jgi:Zn-dependent M16 (insulinase) family peptidase
MSQLLKASKAIYRPTFSSLRSASSTNNFRKNAIDTARTLTPNDTLHGYTISTVSEVPDFNLIAVHLKHQSTNAQHLHLARQDSNNAFGVGFRTTPMNSTGVSHILEHTTLCGSHNYPVRDPFFKMLSRSLATFMNAFTANDWTLYPFSTQHFNDYRNLLSIYLDCIFHPNLHRSDFHQEGWRLEHEHPNDKDSPLVFKGVVFNEMKGVFANPENLFEMELQRKLLPSGTYSHVSGGAPLDILDLTWEDLKTFHSKHYHPSNSRFITYGDIPLNHHLEYINDQVLSHFSPSSPSLQVPTEHHWTHPRVHEISCAPDPMAPDPNKQTTVGVAYLLGSITDPYESFLEGLICKLLIDGPPSPFYQSLIDANIGSDYSPATGYSNGTKDSYFSVGLQGISVDDVDKVKKIISETFEKVAEEGFPEQRIKAVLHQIELSLKHQSSNFGLSLMMHLMSPWIHDACPTSFLEVNRNVERLKEHLVSDPTYLQKKVREYFIDNNHSMMLVMSPDEGYKEHQELLEKDKLTRLIDSLSQEEKDIIYQEGLNLQKEQNKLESSDCLPSLHISDIDKTTPPISLQHEDHQCTPIQYCVQPTNGIIYMKFLSSCRSLPEKLRPYLPLFCSIITRMGTKDMDYRQLAQHIDLYTGDSLSAATHVASHHTMENGLEQSVSFSSHCLDRHLPYMLSLWEDIFNNAQLHDDQRLKTLIAQSASSLSMSVADRGHMYAITAAASSLSSSASLAEEFGGLTQVKFLKELAELDDLEPVVQKLMSIAVHVMDTGCMRCALNLTNEQLSNASTAMEYFLDSLPGSATDTPIFVEESATAPVTRHTHYQLPFPVNYVGQSYRTIPYNHEDSAPLRILAQLLTWKFLHKEIREKGGAYGGGAKHGDGVFSFFSYRDPNSLETIERFRSSIEWVCKGSFTLDDINEAKLSVFSQVDSPVPPSSKGSTHFLRGINDDMRSRYRERLLETSSDDVVTVATKYLRDASHSGSVIIGPHIDDLPPEWTIKSFSL